MTKGKSEVDIASGRYGNKSKIETSIMKAGKSNDQL